MLKKLTSEQQECIIEAGIEEFADRGFEKASIKNIAKNAGISVGVLYKYYKNKDDFFNACLEESLKVLIGKLEEFLEGDMTPRERVKKIFTAVIEFSHEHPKAVKMYHEITSGSFSPKARELAKRIEEISSDTYRAYMKALKEVGLLRPGVDEKAAAFFFDNLLVIMQFSYSVDYFDERRKIYLSDLYDDDEALIEQMVTLVDGALLGR
ncbi:MAG: TetR/AcrR family transcriptional regulator [Lachnospiraceae bacterium]|nr:TetR/AcrR family transcriptional regulator [Lachnospiraceae bacterium]